MSFLSDRLNISLADNRWTGRCSHISQSASEVCLILSYASNRWTGRNTPTSGNLRHLLDSTRATRWRCPHFHPTVSWVFSDFVTNHVCSQLIWKIIGVTSLCAALQNIDVRRNSTESMDKAMEMAWLSTMAYVSWS